MPQRHQPGHQVERKHRSGQLKAVVPKEFVRARDALLVDPAREFAAAAQVVGQARREVLRRLLSVVVERPQDHVDVGGTARVEQFPGDRVGDGIADAAQSVEVGRGGGGECHAVSV
ncbi:hypothetical protein ABT390_09110 [Streptomyces aurantiacus]|uniref:hypothetical protein n=1 Tax=Streptomyces aurantiacus TaxID=47760 RepID=UPI0007C78F5D|nr:hypothetical protein [Streptomyces aurantiacus]